MNNVKIEIFGPEPPCSRCQSIMKNAEEVSKRLNQEGIAVTVIKKKIDSQEVVSMYGVLISPALAINGVVKFMGRVPSAADIEKEIKSMGI